MVISNGIGFYESPFTFNTTPDTDPYTGDQLAIADFNGDGKSDIYHGWKPIQAQSANFDVYYGKGYASTGAVPYRTSAYLASTNALLSQATYTNSFVSPAAKRFWVKVAGIRENLVLEGRTTSAAHEYDNFGNITQSTVTNGVETAVTATVYGAYPPGYPTSPHR